MIQLTTTIEDIIAAPQFSGFREFLFSNCRIPDKKFSLLQMQEACNDWVAESIAYGLNRMIFLADSGIRTAFDFYTEAQRQAEPDKAGTKLFFMPGRKDMPFVLLCPGGAYASVCTLKEGFPVGARLNEMGYNAFVLSYRVQVPDGREHPGILPKPMDDLAAALRFILAHARDFGVCTNGYAVAGFSSGGHLAAEWGTDNCGAVRYGLPKPSAIFLGYPASDTTVYPLFDGKNILLEGMLGKEYAEDEVNFYNVNNNITADYPPVYLWHCKDDNIIPIITSYTMAKVLEENRVPFRFREVAHGGHGFGLGEYSEANGWLEEAVALWEETQSFC